MTHAELQTAIREQRQIVRESKGHPEHAAHVEDLEYLKTLVQAKASD